MWRRHNDVYDVFDKHEGCVILIAIEFHHRLQSSALFPEKTESSKNMFKSKRTLCIYSLNKNKKPIFEYFINLKHAKQIICLA